MKLEIVFQETRLDFYLTLKKNTFRPNDEQVKEGRSFHCKLEDDLRDTRDCSWVRHNFEVKEAWSREERGKTLFLPLMMMNMILIMIIMMMREACMQWMSKREWNGKWSLWSSKRIAMNLYRSSNRHQFWKLLKRNWRYTSKTHRMFEGWA